MNLVDDQDDLSLVGHTLILLVLSCSDSNVFQTIRIYHECEGRIEISVPRFTVWHHKPCRVMANGDPEGWIFLSHPGFYPTLDSFSCSPAKNPTFSCLERLPEVS